jgi:hypothetical protein
MEQGIEKSRHRFHGFRGFWLLINALKKHLQQRHGGIEGFLRRGAMMAFPAKLGVVDEAGK